MFNLHFRKFPSFFWFWAFFANPDPDKTKDKEGTKQFAKAYGSAWSTTYLIKIIASKARPSGNNNPTTAAYQYFSRKIQSDVMFNKVRYHIPYLAVSRYW